MKNMGDFMPPRDRWNDMVVPAAKGLEKFFWNLAWFVVFLVFVFGPQFCQLLQQERKPNDQAQPAADSGATDVSDLRSTTEGGN
jgi:hypothetical protein